MTDYAFHRAQAASADHHRYSEREDDRRMKRDLVILGMIISAFGLGFSIAGCFFKLGWLP